MQSESICRIHYQVHVLLCLGLMAKKSKQKQHHYHRYRQEVNENEAQQEEEVIQQEEPQFEASFFMHS